MAKADTDPVEMAEGDADPVSLKPDYLKEIEYLKSLYDEEMQKRSDNGEDRDAAIDFNRLKAERADRAYAFRIARQQEVVSFLLFILITDLDLYSSIYFGFNSHLPLPKKGMLKTYFCGMRSTCVLLHLLSVDVPI
jgi:hypothetical protein